MLSDQCGQLLLVISDQCGLLLLVISDPWGQLLLVISDQCSLLLLVISDQCGQLLLVISCKCGHFLLKITQISDKCCHFLLKISDKQSNLLLLIVISVVMLSVISYKCVLFDGIAQVGIKSYRQVPRNIEVKPFALIEGVFKVQ